jgi:hypothetical protein
MEFQNNGTAQMNGTKEIANKNLSSNGNAKKDSATVDKTTPATVKPSTTIPSRSEPAKPHVEVKPQVEPQIAKSELTLDAKLKMVNELHRRSVQRLNLISRIGQLETFEINLSQVNDELEDNPYQGCKLIIRDDQNREFVTTTPGLIRLVSQFIFNACNQKLREIEATINFPND